MEDISTHDDTIEWLGVTYRTILSAAQTGGSMSIVDSNSPSMSGPPRHIHHGEDETFVILTGRCKIWIEGEIRIAGPGESVFIPRGREHTFKVVSTEPCRHLVILTPGGFEGFFADMAQGAYRIPEHMQAVAASADRFNMTFTGPPLE